MAAPVVLLHGFTQNAGCWGPVDDLLGVRCEVARHDLPGHGAAGDVRADLWASAGLVAASMHGPATVVGYSMGARVALHLALAHPHLVDQLVLVGGTAGIEEASERAARRRADEALADRVEAVGVPAFLDEWLALPLFAGLPDARAHRAAREQNTAAGLASSLRLAGTGTQDPLGDRVADLRLPVLLVTGAADEKFTAIAQDLVGRFGGPASHVVLAGAGHTAHLEQPHRFVDALEAAGMVPSAPAVS